MQVTLSSMGLLLGVALVGLFSCDSKKKPADDNRAAMGATAPLPRVAVRRRPARPVSSTPRSGRDVEVKFERKGFVLHGTLSLPKHAPRGRRPAYLLVHGSGPQSRRVSVGPVEVFTLLAEALVKKGAVVLRYDKRTFTLRKKALAIKDPAKRKAYIEPFASMLPDDFIADARAAFDFLAARPEVDPTDITVVGHSQGGSFGPDIVRGKPAARLVLLAPGMQRYDKMLVDQLQYQLDIFRKVAGAEEIVQMTKKLLGLTKTLVKKLGDTSIPPSASLMGVSKAFHLRYRALTQDMPKKLREVTIPTLIIQGEKDLKCIPAVLRKMRPALQASGQVQVKFVPMMTHELLLHGIGIFEEDVVKLIWAHRAK